ncbi:hemerythrin domain-containing protein [Amphiplicatus metriothermophilus]|uniref:Hemerythrin-like domain-containing protein n=1 Tax=Amphiplicatus metriothermophilus TaxID=1519374 RepID=A0A239PQG6_9PROT|nr:hemerythrin domain-containing protein [Amphiplicatus metriothermophilus]MBB5518471.1 hemerythrin-like domain-containing protein [Amphiplicatus metriothermophilus]SNT72368.1 Hemerythrin-like domain-containing protein [Amphiplicatus metriothermophilus]
MIGDDRNSPGGAPPCASLPAEPGWGGFMTIEPAPLHLLDRPLDFIFAEHYRQRAVSSLLSMTAEGECDSAEIEAIIRFLESEYRLHIADEELSLFPLLKARCLPEDGIDEAIAKIMGEHQWEEAELDRIIEDLRAIRAGASIDAAMRARLNRFAEQIKQHLAFENGILLPIARVRLSLIDLADLADSMRQRRARVDRGGPAAEKLSGS